MREPYGAGGTDRAFAERIAELAHVPAGVFWRESFLRCAYTKDKPAEAVYELGAMADDCGRRYGREFGTEKKTPQELCAESGLEIREFIMPQSPDVEIFALFEPPSVIFVREDLCSRCDRFISESGIDADLGRFRCLDIILSHEFFHFLEARDSAAIFTRTYREPYGRFKRKVELPPLAEIAAMGFAQEILGLDWSPFLLDSMMLYQIDPQSALTIVERLERFAEECN